MKIPASGRCQCGNVAYQITDDPLMTLACHCLDCQKLSTSSFSVTMVVKRSAIEFSGEMKSWDRPADSGNVTRCWFCPTCGNRIFHENPAATEFIRLKPGTLDDASVLEPQAHVWTCREQPWLTHINELPKIERQPDLVAAMAALQQGRSPF